MNITNDEELADLVIERLNEIARCDRKALLELIEHRVPCNRELADHPTVQVQAYPKVPGRRVQVKPTVGFLGVLNGIIGAMGSGDKKGWGYITALINDDCEPPTVEFERT